MKEINLKETLNGFVVTGKGLTKGDGERVFRSADVLQMLEWIGFELWGTKLSIKDN